MAAISYVTQIPLNIQQYQHQQQHQIWFQNQQLQNMRILNSYVHQVNVEASIKLMFFIFFSFRPV